MIFCVFYLIVYYLLFSLLPTDSDLYTLWPQVSMAFCSSISNPVQEQQPGHGMPEGWMGMSLEGFIFMPLSLHEALVHILKSQT